MRISLITGNPFPLGNASTNRFTTYCRSFAAKGIFIKIIILHPSKSEEAKGNALSGEYNNIHYMHMSKSAYWTNDTNIIKKVFTLLVGLIRSIKTLKNDKIDTIILYEDKFFIYFLYWLFSVFNGVTLVLEKTEYPYGYMNYNIIQRFYMYIKYRFFDGFIIMTEELISYYSKVKASKAKIFLLPMTVDYHRFEELSKKPVPEKYIGCTFGIHNRDGLNDTLKSYLLYKNIIDVTPLKLWIIGDFNKLKNKNELQNYIEENNLIDYVILKGSFRSDKIPQILMDAECLITTPKKYASGGFPTKLGEYLSTGNPVISTRCGEIGNFLVNKKNSFLAEPSDIHEIAEHLVFIQNEPTIARLIGIEGKMLAKTSFNADKYINSLINFLQDFKKNNSLINK